jgi:prepilin peptidase CpaA
MVPLWQAALTFLGLAMAFHDARSLSIPNWIPALLLPLFLAAAVFFYPLERSVLAGLTGAAVLLGGFAMFLLKVLPGGDAKALAAASLFVAPTDWVMLLLSVPVLVALTSALVIIERRRAGVRMVLDEAREKSGFPLGVPIGLALAAYAILFGP